MVFHHLIHRRDRQQLRPSAGMGRLTATLAVTALRPLRRLKPRGFTGGKIGGVARAAADPLPQTGQLPRQGGELSAELLDLQLLSRDEGSDGSWSRQPVVKVSAGPGFAMSRPPPEPILFFSTATVRPYREARCRRLRASHFPDRIPKWRPLLLI